MRHQSPTNEHKYPHIVLLILSIAITIASGTLLYINTLGTAAPPEFITLTETNTISFKAHLTNSKPFGRHYLNETSNYIPMNILDHLEITTNYRATLSSRAQINFLDSAKITVTASQNKGGSSTDSNPVILNRTFPLCNNNEDMTNPETCPDNSGTATTANSDATEHTHERTYHLFLQPYIDFVHSTTESYADYPIKASIAIDFQVSANNNDRLRSIMKRSITFPLTDDNFKLTITGNESQTKDFYALKRSFAETVALIVFGAFAIAGIGLAMLMIKKLLNKKSPYRIELDSYLSDYADAIVKTVTPPELENHPEHIAVESFKELLNLAVSISDPIMYYETSASAVFYITRDSIIYYYIMNNPDSHQRRHHRRRQLLNAPHQPQQESTPEPSHDDLTPEDLVNIVSELDSLDSIPTISPSSTTTVESQTTKITISVEEAQPEPEPEPQPEKKPTKAKKAKTIKKKKNAKSPT